MKKTRNLVWLIAFLLILLLVCIYLTFITVPALKKTEFGQRINYCHNRGSIEFFVEGKKMTYEQIKISRVNPNGEVEEKDLTEDCEFAFYSGYYGIDTYKFFVDKEASERLKDIEITFVKFNENWWNVNNFDLVFDITKRDGKIMLVGKSYLNGKKVILNQQLEETDNLYKCTVDLNEYLK